MESQLVKLDAADSERIWRARVKFANDPKVRDLRFKYLAIFRFPPFRCSFLNLYEFVNAILSYIKQFVLRNSLIII